mmetsp:Transcript_32675/g.78555  ORF Transcript_32675/g.78555 Transcript_32675/m.78555 type:complete len:370 (-) Transcript_32675:69-1178(-)
MEDAVAAHLLAPEQTHSKHSPEPRTTVHSESLDRIVHLDRPRQRRPGQIEQTAHTADHESLTRLHTPACSSDPHKTRQDTVAQCPHRMLLRHHKIQHVRHQTPHRSSSRRVHRHHRRRESIRLTLHRQARSRVESEPAEKQNEGPQNENRNIVRNELVLVHIRRETALTRSHHSCTHKRADASAHVHNPGSSEILVARSPGIVVQPTRPRPRPVHHNRIHKGRHRCHVHGEPSQCSSLGHRSAHNRPARRTECPLKEPVTPTIHPIRLLLQETTPSEVTRTAEAPSLRVRLPVRQTVPDQVPADRGDHHNQPVLAQNVLRVLQLHTPRLQHREPSVHEKDQGSTHKDPACVQRFIIVSLHLRHLRRKLR